MTSVDKKLTSIVSALALLNALAVMIALPLVYWIIAYGDFSSQLEFKAKVKAAALNSLIAADPELWVHDENRLKGLLMREPVPLGTEAVQIFDARGGLLAQ